MITTQFEERTINHDAWMKRFKPLLRGDDLVDVDPRLSDSPLDRDAFSKACDDRLIWTLVDVDGPDCTCGADEDDSKECTCDMDDHQPLVCNGCHFVNALAFYLCEVPYEDHVSYTETND